METQPAPTLTLNDLDHVRREVNAACKELAEMVDMRGDIRRIWDKPRKYFVPETGTWIPFPNGHIWRLVMPVFALPEPTDPIVVFLVEEIISHSQWWEYARQEIIPERFK